MGTEYRENVGNIELMDQVDMNGIVQLNLTESEYSKVVETLRVSIRYFQEVLKSTEDTVENKPALAHMRLHLESLMSIVKSFENGYAMSMVPLDRVLH